MRSLSLFAMSACLLAWSSPVEPRRPPCTPIGPLPDPQCSPGDVETTDLQVVCDTRTRARRNVDEATRSAVFEAYGLSPKQPPGAYECDHLVPLELGGSNSIRNLWPQPAPAFREKDRVENALHRLVCSGKMGLADAQRAIAADWTTAIPDGD
jgi:hypothetical protein